jgi:formylglycine-generating enzyme required for sulfatase activity
MNITRRCVVLTVPILCSAFAAALAARGQAGVAAIDAWRGILRRPAPTEERLAARDDLAKRQAAAAIALLRLTRPESVWPLLRHEPDPTRRSYLIRDIGRSGVPADLIVRRLHAEDDVSARRALILALGEFDGEALPPALRTPLASRLLALYGKDPDPGVHSAIDWLLRHGKQGLADRRLAWNEGDALGAIDRQLTGPPAERTWFVTTEGQTLAMIEGPVEFAMGSPPYETYRPKGPEEAQHRVRIPRSFAVATKEVTVAQFQRFLDAHPAIRRAAQADPSRDPSPGSRTMRKASPDEDCPQVTITWFEAAQYCNWLSRQEGIPEDQWVYPPLDQIKEGMTLRPGHLERTGYRLPTDAEWEFVSRAGATTARSYGSSEELLREYAWYAGNTFAERSWPVGQLKPNDLGLFDVYGNVWEWIHDQWKPYPTDSSSEIRVDIEDVVPIVSAQYKRPRRGGSYSYEAPYLRSAHRGAYVPDERRDSVGFRIARTTDGGRRIKGASIAADVCRWQIEEARPRFRRSWTPGSARVSP